ncbi:MAG: hypothetical protein JXR22_01290 [Prolixibacteraceae bacterium]|nr:hypothetical protein [Prolixibacteraceae bacterium]
MTKQAQHILQELLTALDQKNFDLDVWKTKASLVLKRLFGDESEHIKLIESLHYDYSSWSLRDESGSKLANRVKEQARGIVQAAIMELSLADNPLEKVLHLLLSGEQVQQIQQNLNNEAALLASIQKLDQGTKDQLLARLIKEGLA